MDRPMDYQPTTTATSHESKGKLAVEIVNKKKGFHERKMCLNITKENRCARYHTRKKYTGARGP
jgi:hypothetical protein